MTKIKKAKQAVLNQAMLNPDDFEFFTVNGRGVTVTHRETRKSVEVEPRDGVIRMGGVLEVWAMHNDFPSLDLDGGEYIKVWSDLKDRGEV